MELLSNFYYELNSLNNVDVQLVASTRVFNKGMGHIQHVVHFVCIFSCKIML